MTKIITCSELRHLSLTELEALFRTLQIELGCTAPGSRERAIPVLGSGLGGVRVSPPHQLPSSANSPPHRRQGSL